MKKTLALVSMVVMCSGSSSYAMDDMDHMDMDNMKMMCESMVDMKMKKMDTSGDGMVSTKEHTAGAEKMFKDADTNNDGMLSKDEMMAMKMKEMKDMGMMKDGMMMKKNGMMNK